MSDLTLLRSFVVVSDRGTITDAAAALHVSQPALSRRIALLEQELGAPLLERSRRGVALTGVGRLVDREARDLIARYERLTRDVADHLRLDAGTVRIGGGATAIAFVVPAAIATFRRAHPGVVFQVKEAGSREIEDDVRAARLDLGIVTAPRAGDEVDVLRTGADDIVMVCARQHTFAGASTVAVAELAGHSVIGFEAGSAIRAIIDAALLAAGVQVDVVMELRSIPAILQMVQATRSIAFVSRRAVARARAVRTVRVRGLRIRRELGLIRHARRPLAPAAAAFADALELDAP